MTTNVNKYHDSYAAVVYVAQALNRCKRYFDNLNAVDALLVKWVAGRINIGRSRDQLDNVSVMLTCYIDEGDLCVFGVVDVMQ